MTIGLCMASEMTKLNCRSLPLSSPEVLRILNHQSGFGGETRFRSM